MDSNAIYCDAKMVIPIHRRLMHAPVIFTSPVVGELLEICARRAILPVQVSWIHRPASALETCLQISNGLVRKSNGELLWCHGVHLRSPFRAGNLSIGKSLRERMRSPVNEKVSAMNIRRLIRQ